MSTETEIPEPVVKYKPPSISRFAGTYIAYSLVVSLVTGFLFSVAVASSGSIGLYLFATVVAISGHALVLMSVMNDLVREHIKRALADEYGEIDG